MLALSFKFKHNLLFFANFVIASFPVIMKNGCTIDILYPEYEKKFGTSSRPALVRVVDYNNDEGYRTRNKFTGQWTCYIDGIRVQGGFSVDDVLNKPRTGIFILRPQNKYSQEKNEEGGYDLISNLSGSALDEGSSDDWFILFWDYIQLSNLGVQKADALIAIALNTNLIKVDPISQALKQLSAQNQERILQLIQNVSRSLSQAKISYVSKLLESFGKTAKIIFPTDLVEASKSMGFEHPERFNVFELVDAVTRRWESPDYENPSTLTPFLSFISCISGDGDVPHKYFEMFFPYLDEEYRPKAIRRYFYEIKKGKVKYSPSTQNIFLSQNFYYYSEYRYIFEKWPAERNVSTEFLFDCLTTYESTEQENFQVYNGILNWIVKESVSRQSLIDFNFRDWLLKCEGGVLLNPRFMGFADFQITYEFDEMSFEDEPLESSIRTLIQKSSSQRYHIEKETRVDPKTGKVIIDKNTGKPKIFEKVIYEDIWDVNEEKKGESKVSWKPVVDLFVNWDIKDDFDILPDRISFSKKMIDKSIVREKVLQYSKTKFATITPTQSYRSFNLILNMFGSPITMSAIMYEDTTLGAYENIMKAEEVIDNVKSKLEEIFGESLKCEYDPAKLSEACRISLYNNQGNTTKNCFETRSLLVYPYKYSKYCSPNVSEEEIYLTGKKCASCDREFCFHTCIQREPHWQDFRLIHLLEIVGYKVLDETDAGYIPIKTYRTFVVQINKAVSFFKRLRCRECNHILFPMNNDSNSPNLHGNFKCMNPFCSERNKKIYLTYCFQCKKTIIDSRDTKKCPNGKCICPTCKSCCSNKMFDDEVQRQRLLGHSIPARTAAMQGKGHKDNNMFFCPTCGKQMLLRNNCEPNQWQNYFCPDCNQSDEENPKINNSAFRSEEHNYYQ